MITLLADRLDPDRAVEVQEFGRLAGLWATRIRHLGADGSHTRVAEGEWEFGLALGGRAVLDVWQVPGRSALAVRPRSADQECGLCVRIWDPRLQLWRFTFHSTAASLVIHMYARRIDEEIVMERAEGSDLVRWIFADVRQDSFRWRSERSRDGGRSWTLEQDLDARRVAGEGSRSSGGDDDPQHQVRVDPGSGS